MSRSHSSISIIVIVIIIIKHLYSVMKSKDRGGGFIYSAVSKHCCCNIHSKYKRAKITCWTLKHGTNTSIDELLLAQRSSFPVGHLLSFIKWSSKAESDKITQAFLFSFHNWRRVITDGAIFSCERVMQRFRTHPLYLPQYSNSVSTGTPQLCLDDDIPHAQTTDAD